MLRDLADLVPRRGRRLPDLALPIAVQAALAVKVVVAGWSTFDLTWIVATVFMLVIVHLVTVRTHRVLLSMLDTTGQLETALRAELAEANTDHLTGLPTRRFIYRHLDQAPPDTQVSVAFADADGLKGINDQLGHAAGDDHLNTIADLLRTAIEPGDMLVRLGGDEFALATTRTPEQLAATLTRILLAPATGTEQPPPTPVSVGIVRGPGGDAHTALGCAEAAMRTAKQRHSFLEHYDADRDGTPLPPGVRPAARPRDQRPESPRRRGEAPGGPGASRYCQTGLPGAPTCKEGRS